MGTVDWCWLRIPQFMDQVYGRPGIFKSKLTAVENFLVDHCVQTRKTVGELKLISIHLERLSR